MSRDEQIGYDPAEDVMAEFVDEEVEVVDGLPVLAEVRPVAAVSAAALPAVQTAAAMATGFVAGAATVALIKVLGGRRTKQARISPRRGDNGLPIIGTRSFLVDVHLIGKSGG